jgi:hypothetical protein
LPISKTDSLAGTLRGRYKALRRRFRDRKAEKLGREIIEADLQRDRFNEFVRRVKFGTGDPAAMEKLLKAQDSGLDAFAAGIERGKLSSLGGSSR